MVGEIAAALSSLKAAGDIAKAMMDIRDASVFQSKAVDLQRQILSAQESALAANERQTALIERIDTLEAEVATLEAWGADKERYELKPMREGNYAPLAYAPKEGMAGTEPAHWICPTCYQHAVKSLLQVETRYPGMVVTWCCHECGTELVTSGQQHTGQTRPKGGAFGKKR